jgi:hypothetical protein
MSGAGWVTQQKSWQKLRNGHRRTAQRRFAIQNCQSDPPTFTKQKSRHVQEKGACHVKYVKLQFILKKLSSIIGITSELTANIFTRLN